MLNFEVSPYAVENKKTESIPLSFIDQQVRGALRTANFNANKASRPILTKKPVDKAKPDLAYTVSFPDSAEQSVVAYKDKSVGAYLPSNQGFVDYLCSSAVKEVRKLPFVSLVPKETLHSLCVLGIKKGAKSIPSLVKYVKSKLTARRMARLTNIKSTVKQQKPAKRLSSAMSSMSVSAPVSIGRRIASRNKPRFANRSGNVVISHTEFLGNIYSDSTTLLFNANSYVINPGNSGTFPWLSTFAANFDKYKMHKLVIHIVSNQPTSIAGRIGVGIDYDSTDPLPADRGEFFNLTHHQETSPWDSMVFPIPIKPEEKFINSHTVVDSKLIDCGQIIVMADQIVATDANLADIIVEYTVELIQPQQAIFMTQKVAAPAIAAFSSMTTTGPVIAKQVTTTSTTELEFTIPVGYYLVAMSVLDTEAGSPVITPTLHSATGTRVTVSNTSATTVLMQCHATGPDSKIKFTYSGVTIGNLESNVLDFSRISAAVYHGRPYGTAVTTY
jgi:hypothetical protein